MDSFHIAFSSIATLLIFSLAVNENHWIWVVPFLAIMLVQENSRVTRFSSGIALSIVAIQKIADNLAWCDFPAPVTTYIMLCSLLALLLRSLVLGIVKLPSAYATNIDKE